MEYRPLNLIIVSANGLKKPSFTGRMDVYAVASISGNAQKLKTTIDKHGESNPTWNFPMKFNIDEAAGLQTLVVKIKAVGIFGGRNLGEVHVPVKELLEPQGKTTQFVSYQVRRPSGKPKGVLNFSYEIGEKFTGKPVMAYPPTTGGRYPPQQQSGYGYPQQQPGYSYYPPPPPVAAYSAQPPRSRMGNSGMGFGTGLLGGALGGMLLGDMMSDAAHGGGCGGGGCGGGGCGGGGCGGGGCGGF